MQRQSSIYVSLRLSVAMILAACAASQAGCGTRRYTDTARTGSEQLLVSAAIDRAVEQLDFAPLAGRAVFVDSQNVDRVDKSFLTATVKSAAWQSGARMVNSADQAEYILELRSGSVGVDRDEYIFGVPASELPMPGAAVSMPEAALFKTLKQGGAVRVSFIVYSREDHSMLYAAGPAYGFSDQRSWWIAGAGPHIRDNIQPKRNADNTATVATPQPAGNAAPPTPQPAAADDN